MKRYRMLAVSGVGLVAVLAGLLFFGNLNQNLVYYLTPQEAVAQRADFADGRRFQLGGLVEKDSVVKTANGLRFTLTSGTGPGSDTVAIEHHGAPAQLFQSGIGVVLEGSWRGDVFVSDTMKVKHDENYQPPAPDGEKS
ncbi:cytochrome c-type biogenesis protein CcmE [Saccharomonospora glauca K62]|uniref:Cytochrome c-type biogenesis protein CcmE n=2 Tax=Saccharomonospora glauca TaxID=40990 RepID=I1D4G2_9PSEU|nr:cytochrome c-type biogenesis protein CcmE [Saccharomonospora glauca K62]